MTRELLLTLRKFALPITILSVAFYAIGPFAIEGIAAPLWVSILLMIIALLNMFVGICGNHYALNYDGKFKPSTRALIVYVVPPFLIALEGSKMADVQTVAEGHLAIAVIAAFVLTLVAAIAANLRFTKVYGPLYENAQRQNALAQLEKALDALPKLPPKARASIESRMQTAPTAEIFDTAASLRGLARKAPEALS